MDKSKNRFILYIFIVFFIIGSLFVACSKEFELDGIEEYQNEIKTTSLDINRILDNSSISSSDNIVTAIRISDDGSQIENLVDVEISVMSNNSEVKELTINGKNKQRHINAIDKHKLLENIKKISRIHKEISFEY